MPEKSIRESIEENGAAPEKVGNPQKAYQKFFEGYTPILVPRAGGRGQRVRYEYTGEYYVQELSERERRGIRCFYVISYLAIWAGFVPASIAQTEANCVWYVGLPQAISLLGLSWLFIALIYYVPAPRLLTIYLRRTMIGFHFRSASFCTLLGFVWLCLAYVLWIIMHLRDAGRTELGCLLAYVLCTCLAAAVYHTEKNVRYIPLKDE